MKARAATIGMSQADLCRSAGISKQSMSGYWNGDRLCPSDKLFPIADALGVSARWLVSGNGSPMPPIEHEGRDLAFEDQLLADLQLMTDDQRRLCRQIVDAVLGRHMVDLHALRPGDRLPPTLHAPATGYRSEGD